MPIDYKKYPKNWKTEIRPRILKRAGNKCEFCGVENKAFGYRDKNGHFIKSEGLQIETDTLDGRRLFYIVLTVAHLSHDISDNRPDNLRALCQKCHLNYDKEQHRQTKYKNKLRNQPDLFKTEVQNDQA